MTVKSNGIRKDGRLELRLEEWILTGIDIFRRDEPDLPNRSEAARRLIAYGLDAVRRRQATESLKEAHNDLQRFVEQVKEVRRPRTLQTPIEEIAPQPEIRAADEERRGESGAVPGTAVG